MDPVVWGAEHCAVLPPLLPAQLQAHGLVPLTEDAVPDAHRFVVGAAFVGTPSALPHAPVTGAICVTLIENAGSETVLLPSLTVMMMPEKGPTLAEVGVPES